MLGLVVLAVGLFALAYLRGDDDDNTEAPAPPSAQQASTAGAAPASAVQAQAAAAPAEGGPVDVFPSQKWDPPPPPGPDAAAIAAAPPPPPPEPPPMPFTVRSLWLDQDGTFYVVLNASGKEFPICAGCKRKGFLSKGDVLMDAYKVEDINRKEVRFLYLPMKRGQRLSLGGGK